MAKNDLRVARFHVHYDGEIYFGASVDQIARGIMHRHKDVTFAEAVRFTERNLSDAHENGSKFNAVKRETFNDRNDKLKNSKGKSVTWNMIQSGAMAVIKNLSGNTAPQIEIDRRSDICRKCPKMSNLSVCVPCGGAKKLLTVYNTFRRKYFKRGYNIDHDLKDKFCDVCTCSLAVMIPCKLEDFSDLERSNPNRPSECWVVQPEVDPKTIN